ncbi:hypothetical protein DFJ73DRAFT_926748 [Zopfochytrium polystomum]|nr:hypothetical protein DFJ73DRAFT_926748 [Zopfochytrium polystomum]
METKGGSAVDCGIRKIAGYANTIATRLSRIRPDKDCFALAAMRDDASISLLNITSMPKTHRRPAACGVGRVAAVIFTTLVLAVLVLFPRGSNAGKTVSVGGTTVDVGDNVGRFGHVYHAKDSKGNAAIYKERLPGTSFSSNEIDATKKAGQYIAHDDNAMVQKKVGEQDLLHYLRDKRQNPSSLRSKPNSADIIKQVEAQQKKVGYMHRDVRHENIRVSENVLGKPKYRLVDWGNAKKKSETTKDERKSRRQGDRETIQTACAIMGFKFRASDSGGLYRRSASCRKNQGAAGGKKKK